MKINRKELRLFIREIIPTLFLIFLGPKEEKSKWINHFVAKALPGHVIIAEADYPVVTNWPSISIVEAAEAAHRIDPKRCTRDGRVAKVLAGYYVSTQRELLRLQEAKKQENLDILASHPEFNINTAITYGEAEVVLKKAVTNSVHAVFNRLSLAGKTWGCAYSARDVVYMKAKEILQSRWRAEDGSDSSSQAAPLTQSAPLQ